MGLLDKNPQDVNIVNSAFKKLKSIFNTEDISIHGHNYSNDSTALVGVLYNIAVFVNQGSVKISKDGVDGELTTINLNTSNFPNLIESSYIVCALILPWTRNPYKSGFFSILNGKQWRVVVITNKCQVYHNFPSHYISKSQPDGSYIDGDEYRFEESVVWDLPTKVSPVKTTTGTDAALINTGAYRYMPAFPDSVYEMHPAISNNEDGFPAVYEYTDSFSNTIQKRPRFLFENRNEEVNPLIWMSGVIQDNQMSVIGTYRDNTSKETRTVIFTTSDGGRQWFAQYEFGAKGRMISKNNKQEDYLVNNAIKVYSDVTLAWIDDNTPHSGVGSGVYKLKKRSQYIPSDNLKNITELFKYDDSFTNISSISNSNTGIIVTTSSAHNLSDGDIIVIEKSDDVVNDWDWIVSKNHTAQSAGNGVIWKVSDVTSTTFKLRYEVSNPYNNISCRHIHAINRIKDGYIVSCGEGYPFGWILWIKKEQNDSYINHFAWDKFPTYRLTSSPKSVQRLLGMYLYDDGTIICASDNDNTPTSKITLPNGGSVMRNSTGIYKGKIEDIDDFSSFQCIHESNETAFFFQRIMGVLIYCGMRQEFAWSFDEGQTWSDLYLPIQYWGSSAFIGYAYNKSFGIKTSGIWESNTLFIELKK